MPESFVSDVTQIERSSYVAVGESFTEHMSAIDGVLWIGSYGSIGLPGVSDIDLMVVCEDARHRQVVMAAGRFRSSWPLAGYLFVHPPLIVPWSSVPWVLYIQTLENLQTLWGGTDVIDRAEKPGEPETILRTVLWNSLWWSHLAHACGEKAVSVRRMLLWLSGVAKSTAGNFEIAGQHGEATATLRNVGTDRRSIVAADPRTHGDLASAAMRRGIERFNASDWIVNERLVTRGWLIGDHAPWSIDLSLNQVAVFGMWEGRSERGHWHAGDIHITRLPAHYGVIGSLISPPYLKRKGSLSRAWAGRNMECAGDELKAAAAVWCSAVDKYFGGLEEAGADPMSRTVSPFNMNRQIPYHVAKLARWSRRWMPLGLREWLRPRMFA